MAYPHQGEVFWANLDPTIGREIRKRRPVLVLSPDEMNQNLGTVIAAPLTSTHRPWPTRCRISYRGRPSSVALDQIRCLDVARLGKRLAVVDAESALHILRTMFA
ncbi:MAG: type II toxin-antitoxin system PemK/MazF family toxin [Betaproteobacteria bacterium]|nr:type II toxin-antitoxin system PemK/MazF family toxin [Betaproteobacteria bacterium]